MVTTSDDGEDDVNAKTLKKYSVLTIPKVILYNYVSLCLIV